MRTITALAFVAMSASASADDLPTYDWSGLYFGANGGYGWANAKGIGFSASGALAGGQIGLNWQSGKLVFGPEIDFQWSGQGRERTTSTCEAHDGGVSSVAAISCVVIATYSLNFFGAGRVRVGAAFDRVLVYATGGAAWAHLASSRDSGSGLGWTVGAGLEFAVTDNTRLKFEYTFLDAPRATLAGNGYAFTFDLKDSVARVGVNVRFPTP
jgi:outer membrane immunogenic protein